MDLTIFYLIINMLASSSMGSQPSLAQEIPPTYFGLSTWLLMILPCLLPIHIISHEKLCVCAKNKNELLDFLHRAALIPTVSSWKNSINNNFFATWPGLTAYAVRKFLPDSINTAKGIMKTAPKICNPPNSPRPYNMNPLLWRRRHLPLWILPSEPTLCI